MTRHRARAWLWFAATALPLVLVLAWVTATLVRLDHDEVQARQQAELHEKLRLALWRMDSWLSPQLAREARRPPAEYQSFPPTAGAWTRGYDKLAPDEVLVQSPLLGFESELMLLHFELQPDGSVSSPQVPTGNQRDLAEANGIDAAVLQRAAQRLASLQPRLRPVVLQHGLQAAESLLPMVGCNGVPPDAGLQTQQSVAEYSNRQVSNMALQGGQQWRTRAAGTGSTTPVPEPSTVASTGSFAAQSAGDGGVPSAAGAIGPMVPLWLDGEPSLLAFGRRVQDARGARLQGVVLDWSEVSRQLCGLVGDLFTADCVHLLRCEQPSPAEQASMLASVPARLAVTLSAPVAASGLPTTSILGITWGVTVLGLLVLAFTLRAAIGFGERRARFASAVTHELRTPLTTFRMYSEMLADGVVTEPKARQEYLSTLQRESDRLARVVENVLAWSRLEEGRFTSRRQVHAVAELVHGIEPVLRRRLIDAGMELRVAIDAAAAAASTSTDEDAVGQILFNLVDNAAKHAHAAQRRIVELHVHASADAVRCTVRDHGPGVPPSHRRSIFAPFDRGALPNSSNDVPGVGLGLPLARGLARDLGGDLTLDPDVTPGACFVLTLPRA
ncbi:MAG: HAMP domain-containing histidine kinase [Planctomycetes bacterium]|nr:HAMP domain-containing histidine kinase [Planctomycetota bacterium]